MKLKIKSLWLSQHPDLNETCVTIDGSSLTIDKIAQVAHLNCPVAITHDREILNKIISSCNYIKQAVADEKNIYGVTTSFGGLSHIKISKQDTKKLQENLFYFLKSGAGNKIAICDVRSGMLLRANSLIQGISGIRLKIIERLVDFLNLQITPVVHEFGSIGASGDLIPLASVGGAILGLNKSFKVIYKNKEIDALEVLKRFNLPRISLHPKEALAILNGTSMLTGIAANCTFNAKLLLHITLFANALLLQGLNVSSQPFDLFIHQSKPHIGQYWVAVMLLSLLNQSRMIRADENPDYSEGTLRQDRYSSRCLPQYLGPIVDGLETIAKQIAQEANSVTDNPLIDTVRQISLHGGNFLGEYPAMAMDQLRYYLSFMAKHLDVQIANVVSPAFNNGLPPSLIGNTNRAVNCGLKGLQLCGNSIMPVLLHLANPLANLYPTHAEEYNQNISSLGYESSLLANRTIEIYRQYSAIALLFGLQAVSLRAKQMYGDYDPRPYLSPSTAELYEVIFNLLGKRITKKRPYVWNDDEQSLDEHIAIIADDIKSYNKIPKFIFSSFV